MMTGVIVCNLPNRLMPYFGEKRPVSKHYKKANSFTSLTEKMLRENVLLLAVANIVTGVLCLPKKRGLNMAAHSAIEKKKNFLIA